MYCCLFSLIIMSSTCLFFAWWNQAVVFHLHKLRPAGLHHCDLKYRRICVVYKLIPCYHFIFFQCSYVYRSQRQQCPKSTHINEEKQINIEWENKGLEMPIYQRTVVQLLVICDSRANLIFSYLLWIDVRTLWVLEHLRQK